MDTAPREDEGDGAIQRQKLGSIDQAMRALGLPLENHQIVRQLTATVGIRAYYRTASYIKAVRSGDGPDLHIAIGYTNGFVSEDEAAAAGGITNVGPSSRGWLVIHPTNALRSGGGTRTTAPERDYAICPKCRTTRSASGACECD
jgi:hypothetical protein